jgi:PAS domain S-box-containing protein
MLVATTLVTVTTLLFGAFGAVDHLTRWNDEWSRLHRVTAAQSEELAVALAAPVWNFDHPQIGKILDSQEGVTPVEAIVVVGAGRTQARVRDARRRFVPSNGSFPTAGLIVESRPITFSNEPIGTVRLYTTPKFIEQQLREALTRTVITILTVDLLLIVFVYLVLWRTVLKPIVAIERYAGIVSSEGTANVPSLRPAPTAELESLRVSIETMVRLLDHRYAELQESIARRFESEERFRTIFESVNDAIFILDHETGAILDVNPRMYEMFGYAREDIEPLDLGSLSSGVTPYTRENAIQQVRNSKQGDRYLFEWHTRHKDGHVFWVEVSVRSAVIDGVERVVAVVRDVEQRKQMEEALHRGETMSAMGALVAGVAHEVRNPLFGMSALLDAYEEEMSSPDLRELSTGLREQISRLTQLMRELLELGRPVQITLAPDSLPDLITEVMQSRRQAAAAVNVTLNVRFDEPLPPVPMDRSRLRQVFENVIDNALQHSPSVQNITVGATAIVRSDGPWIDCTVEDDGSGFQTADLGRVFEPFFTRRERGIGLGMSIVQRIVEEHGGRVTAGNRPAGGAVITLRIPTLQSEARSRTALTRAEQGLSSS